MLVAPSRARTIPRATPVCQSGDATFLSDRGADPTDAAPPLIRRPLRTGPTRRTMHYTYKLASLTLGLALVTELFLTPALLLLAKGKLGRL